MKMNEQIRPEKRDRFDELMRVRHEAALMGLRMGMKQALIVGGVVKPALLLKLLVLSRRI